MITRLLKLGLLLVCCCVVPAFAVGVADNESATHSSEAAQYQIINTYIGTGYNIVQFNLGVLSHYSYLVVSEGKVLAVDPGRDVQTYLDYAVRENLEWVGTFLTHSHADFVAGHREMEFSTGTPIFVGHKSGALFPHRAVKEDETITVGSAVIRIMETPGHTPDSLCGIVCPANNLMQQEFILSGDTLFVGSFGRPDLMGGSFAASELAAMMFETWNYKLSKLSDNAVILPAHGAGSLCGANMRDEPSSTIGEEKASNPYIKFANDRSAFIANFLTGLEPAPRYFAENAKINQMGPERVDWADPFNERLTSLDGLIEQKEVYIIDLRDSVEYSRKHIPRSVNIALRGRLETWTGILVPFTSRLVLTGNAEEVREGAKRLKRVGYNADYILFEDYLASGGRSESAEMVAAADLHQLMRDGKAPVVVDVRKPAEWMGMRIGEVLNIPLDTLEADAARRLNRQEPVVAVCNSAFRSSLAVGLFKRAGFTNVVSMEGGAEAWVDAGLPVRRISDVSGAAASQNSDKTFRNPDLPDRLVPAQLRQMLKDLPGTFEVVDIRPAAQVLDYNPVGAVAVDLVDLLESPKWLAGDVPLVIVDRDGSLAMIVAGILSRKTRRPVKALLGGIEAYWQQIETGFIRERIIESGKTVGAPDHGSAKPDFPAAVPVIKEPMTPKSSPQSSPKPVRKGAGC
ncbi:MAG: MBL fold metallo-hydrolase [Candidatus Riflebacteria bacterium HGW-Riflebacteria-2]|jgi:rhodanese-related sulfurtransferase/glyoxylase-like metal-dependent hydrolase (beta-lactamase superfamily II)|nr:MAG: MBL fold metallo-hydrolase [Candidatus Riflebacteria bacterium HGW-Riflebacteria-2]